MKILVNGCSFSRGPKSWPYYIQSALEADLCNLAQSGAGNTYIRQSTMVELSQRTYDLVLIMWSGLERFDVQVEDIDFFKTPYTSKYQSSQNDWPEKIVIPINDQDYVEKNWVFGVGYIKRDSFLKTNDLFPGFYKYLGQEEHVRRSMLDMICLQDFLRVRNLDYAFSFYQDYMPALQSQQDLWSMIDHSKLVPGDLNSLSHKLESFDLDGIHPGTAAHDTWSQHVLQHLRK
jgi:hypothetical protein